MTRRGAAASLPVATSHTRAVPSQLPDTSSPPAVHDSEMTPFAWPSSVRCSDTLPRAASSANNRTADGPLSLHPVAKPPAGNAAHGAIGAMARRGAVWSRLTCSDVKSCICVRA